MVSGQSAFGAGSPAIPLKQQHGLRYEELDRLALRSRFESGTPAYERAFHPVTPRLQFLLLHGFAC